MNAVKVVSRRVLSILQHPPQRLHVLSVHARACNFLAEDGTLVSLVSPRVGPGPFHVVLSEDVDFHTLCAHAPVLWVQNGFLALGKYRFPLSPAVVWSPEVQWPRSMGFLDEVYRRGRNVLDQQQEEGGFLRVIRHHIQEGVGEVLTGMERGDGRRMSGGVKRLAGLGPGLTPAGDDALLGILAALHALDQEEWLIRVRPFVEELALSHTTSLSAAWLRYALEGAFSEPWHRLAKAWAQENGSRVQEVLESIRSIGATSGYYALLGFVRGLESIATGSSHPLFPDAGD